MIIIFHVSDTLGRHHRCSTVCGPSTTAVGAINQLRLKLFIPTEVEVKVHLANDVAIRHVTAPLTSLRKQRGGSAQVLRLQLWASLTGPAAAVQEINYAAAEAVDPANAAAEEEEEEEESSEGHLSASPSGRQSTSSAAPASTRIMFAGPPSRTHVKPVQAKVPVGVTSTMHAKSAAEPNAAADSTTASSTTAAVKEAPQPRRPSPAAHQPTAGDRSAAAEDKTPTPSLTSPPPESTATANNTTLVIKRRESRAQQQPPTGAAAETQQKPQLGAAAAAYLDMPLSARGPVRRPPVDVQRAELLVPQSARGAAPPRPSALAAARAGVRAEAAAAAGETGGLFKTGVARRDAALGHIILREYPKIISREPKAIVAAVKDNTRLATLSFSAEFTAVSDVDGVNDATYARCLSIGLTHGQELRTTTTTTGAAGRSEGARMALYGELSSLRHSCCPNAAVLYDLFTAPYAGSCRCALLAGIQQGQEITYLYKHADSLAFLLLSRDRRRNLLRRRYFMDCNCPRCTEVEINDEDASAAAGPIVKAKGSKTGTAKAKAQKKIGSRTKAQREAEATLTGAFFADSTVDRDAAKQQALMEEMRTDFDALQIVDDTGVEITLSLVGNVPPLQRAKQCNRLLAFLRKYGTADSVLRLHEHHWRMNLARAAYVQETVRLCAVKGATPEARQRDPQSSTLFTPTKTAYDVCLKQLAVEALFIPAGHPHSLTTYESFLYLVAILPPTFAQSVLRQAHNTESIKWTQLEATKEAWSVLKRTTLPPQVRQLVQRKENATAATGAAAAELPSQPTTARGPRKQELPPAPTIKLPPKKSKAHKDVQA